MNPELRRNLWLEISIHRMVVMPIVLALVFVLFYYPAREEGAARLVASAIGVFIALVHIWGSRQASESITNEVRERTWDWQRLSSLGPWPMTWGKLAGAPAFQWYGGAICLIVLLFASTAADLRNVGWSVLALVASGIAMHGVVIAASLQQARKNPKHANRVGVLLLFPVLVAGLGVFTAFAPAPRSQLAWYGYDVPVIRFVALSSCAFAAWALLGAYREMSRELKVLRMPWAYPAFTVFLAAFLAGFARSPGQEVNTALIGAGVAAALFYYALFAEETTAMSLRRLAIFTTRGDWRRAADAMPLWMPAAIMAVAFLVAAAFVEVPTLRKGPITLGPPMLAMALLVLRDAAILVFFALSPKGRRAEGVALLYLALIYWIIPVVLDSMGLSRLAHVVLPVMMAGWLAVATAAGHVVIAAALAAWRWRLMQERFERS